MQKIGKDAALLKEETDKGVADGVASIKKDSEKKVTGHVVSKSGPVDILKYSPPEEEEEEEDGNKIEYGDEPLLLEALDAGEVKISHGDEEVIAQAK